MLDSLVRVSRRVDILNNQKYVKKNAHIMFNSFLLIVSYNYCILIFIKFIK